MKKALLNNLTLKIISLCLAIVSWYAIRDTISFEVQLKDIPVEIRLKEGWAVFHQSDNVVNVTFRGSQEDIRLMDRKQIKAVLDLRTNVTASVCEVVITPKNIEGIRSVRAVTIVPDRISVSLDREAEKKVPVKSRTVGKPLAGEVGDIIPEPAIVLLRGPAKQLEITKWVHTEPVDVEGRMDSFTKRCSVLPPDDTWTPVFEPSEVQVRVMFVKKTETLKWNNVSVSAVIKPGSVLKLRIKPSQVNISVTGTAPELAILKEIIPKAFIDCVDLDPSLTYDLPVNVFISQSVNVVVAVEPAMVKVAFE